MSITNGFHMDAAQKAVARSEIRAIFDRYAILARDGASFRRIAEDCFARDAIYRLPSGDAVPPSRLSEVLQGEEAKYIRHHVTTCDIKFINTTEALAETEFIAFTDSAAPDHWGCWKDTVKVQPDGTWKLQDRRIQIDGGVPYGWYMKQYGKSHKDPEVSNPHTW